MCHCSMTETQILHSSSINLSLSVLTTLVKICLTWIIVLQLLPVNEHTAMFVGKQQVITANTRRRLKYVSPFKRHLLLNYHEEMN